MGGGGGKGCEGGEGASDDALPLMVMLSGVLGVGGGGTPLVTGFPGVLNIRSVKEKVPLSTVISLKRLSSFHAAVSSSNNLPAKQSVLSHPTALHSYSIDQPTHIRGFIYITTGVNRH